MSRRFNGGIRGKLPTISTSSASGMWDLLSAQTEKGASNWPSVSVATMPTGSMLINLDAGNPSSYSGSGSIWYDLSGSGTNATINGSPTFSTNYFTLNGTSQDFTTSYSYAGPQSFTIFAIFRTSSASGRKLIGFQTPLTGEVNQAYDRTLYVDTSGYLRFGVYNAATITAQSSTTVTNNAWTLAVGTFGGEGSTLRVYVNNASSGTATSSQAENYTGGWRIGGWSNAGWPGGGSSGYFPGDIGAAGVYNRALSSLEVTQIYNYYKGTYGLP
jgi:hypothetical protein